MIPRAILIALFSAALACSHGTPRKYDDSRGPGVYSRFDCVNETITYHDDNHPDAGLDAHGFVAVDQLGYPMASSIGCQNLRDQPDNGKGK